MKKSVLLLTLLLIFCCANAQFYYNDVVDLKAANAMYANLVKNNVQEITAASAESDNTPTTGFTYSKTLKNNGAIAETHTGLETGGVSSDYDTYTNGLIAKSQDVADSVSTTVEYMYDNEGKILTVKTRTDDTTMDTHSTELHQWFYTGSIPDSMLRIKNGGDTTSVHFKKDGNQNIVEELWLKRGHMIEHYFYYYNDKNQLTDIVRFNARAKQMLPDYMFEYNDNGTLSQLTQIPQGSSDYVIWQYEYDSRGLKTKDVLLDKHKGLLGTVSYTYR
ncbi:hypothetical protein [Parafilimonas sp.]|uniref:hypothetical protein n=1 Tax=Parafilimonas sp. TaxID=1969739 RepID=UPI0039E5C229